MISTAQFKMMKRTAILINTARGPLIDARALAEYKRCFNAHSTCEDYRASATIDLVHDRKSREKLRMPVLALWGRQGVIAALFDCLRDWREVAADVRGRALPCGHFIPEEKPRELVSELRRFLTR